MAAPLLILPRQAELAHDWINRAPDHTVVKFFKPKRTIPQNDRMWAMLADISSQQPRGIKKTPDVWKALMMNACGHDVQFEMGLNGEPFPLGFRSSKLTKEQMGDLMEFMAMWGVENGVVFKGDAQ